MSHDSTRKPRSRKGADRPKKPYPDFPLSPHASGAWQKKIRGKIHYFGKWARRVDGKLVRIEGDGWKEALDLYKAQADDLHAGRTPRVTSDGLTVADLCNRFLTSRLRKVEAGEMGERMFAEYKQTTDRLVSTFGKTRLASDLAADDFEALRADLAKQYGPVRLGNEVQKVRTLFKYAYESGLIDRPVRYGPQFKKPSKGVLRKHRAATGQRMFEADELRKLIDAAGVPLKAMILLGVNAAFGNTDVAALPRSAVDLGAGWVDFPRPKTGIARRCPLWPETVSALREALAERPEPKDEADAGLAFVTKYGHRWVRAARPRRAPVNSVALEFGKLLRTLGIDERQGRGFYALRHTFRTVADAARDPVAIDLIMGHSDLSMGGHYRERIDDGRLRAVVEHVRAWVFGEAPDDGTAGEPESTAPETSARCDPADPPGQDEGDARPMLRLYVG
jgi:integrase